MANDKDITSDMKTLSIEVDSYAASASDHQNVLQEYLKENKGQATQIESEGVDHTEQGPRDISSDGNVTPAHQDAAHIPTCQVCLLCFQTQTTSHICLECDYYLCSECSRSHKDHDMVCITDEHFIERVKRRVRLEDNPLERFKCEKVIVCNNIDARKSNNDDFCNIKGIAVSQYGKVAVMTDRNACCVKVVDLQQNSIVRSIELEDKPWGITTISCHGYLPVTTFVVAVTFPSRKEILVYDIDNRSKRKVYPVFDECFDIVYHDDQFVTLCNRYKSHTRFYLNFLHKSGLTSRIIKLNIQPDLPLGGNKVYFALHPKKQNIYVSNGDKHVVLKLNYEGQVLRRYHFQPFEKPTGICLDGDQNVYISFFSEVYKQSYLSRRSDDLAELKSLLLSEWSRCEALHFSRDMFFTSMRKCDELPYTILPYRAPTYSLGTFKIE